MALKSRFERTGVVGAVAPDTATAASPQEVKVFMATSPEGFSLKENELKVEDGYQHRIIGWVEIRLKEGGFCDIGGDDKLSRNRVINLLQERAYREGGNAVIYAVVYVFEDEDLSDCERFDQFMKNGPLRRPWGRGWIVVMTD